MSGAILLIGADGSMGKRYQAIFRFLNRPVVCMDKQDPLTRIQTAAQNCAGAVIATPTETHLSMIRALIPTRIPILCEKPVSKSVDEVKEIREAVERERIPFRMMFQYSLLASTDRLGRSRYDYFRHGNDGLVWDCLQIIGLARGPVDLFENSPVWSCVINGRALQQGSMDAAYVAYVQGWLAHPHQDLGLVQAIHEKTAEMAKARPHE